MRCTTESVSDCALNGLLVNRLMKIISLFPFFSVLLVFYSLSQPVVASAHRQGDSCLHCAAVNLQGLADQAHLGNN